MQLFVDFAFMPTFEVISKLALTPAIFGPGNPAGQIGPLCHPIQWGYFMIFYGMIQLIIDGNSYRIYNQQQ